MQAVVGYSRNVRDPGRVAPGSFCAFRTPVPGVLANGVPPAPAREDLPIARGTTRCRRSVGGTGRRPEGPRMSKAGTELSEFRDSRHALRVAVCAAEPAGATATTRKGDHRV